MTQDTEQYRAGFEAWARETWMPEQLQVRDADEYDCTSLNAAWHAWTASKREASTEPSAWMCAGSVEPEFTADALLAGYWMRKGRTVTPLYAEAGALTDDAKDAARYRWLKERFTGFDFYWMGDPQADRDEDKGKCVIVFECGQGFNAGRDVQAGIDAAIEAHTKAGSGKGEKK